MSTHAGLYTDSFLDSAGHLLRGVSFQVFEMDGTTPSVLYTDRLKSATAANPTVTDQKGNASFYADAGVHVVICQGGAIAVEVPLDAAEGPRVTSILSSATPAINTDLYDEFNITGLAVNITSMTSGLTGSPVDGDRLMVRIKDNGSARTIAWGASFVSSGTAALLTATLPGKTHFSGFVRDAAAAKWVCLAVDAAGY